MARTDASSYFAKLMLISGGCNTGLSKIYRHFKPNSSISDVDVSQFYGECLLLDLQLILLLFIRKPEI
jgi:hypothetical protein